MHAHGYGLYELLCYHSFTSCPSSVIISCLYDIFSFCQVKACTTFTIQVLTACALCLFEALGTGNFYINLALVLFRTCSGIDI